MVILSRAPFPFREAASQCKTPAAYAHRSDFRSLPPQVHDNRERVKDEIVQNSVGRREASRVQDQNLVDLQVLKTVFA